MLTSTLDDSDASSQDKPLWSIAAFVTLAAFGTSVLAQWLVLLFEQRSGQTSIAQSVDTPLSLARGAMVVQFALGALIFAIMRRHSILRRRALVGSKLPFGALLNSLGLVLGLAPVANDLGFRISQAMHQWPDNARWVTEIVQHANTFEFLILGIVLALVPAFIEELLFRGVLMGALSGGPFWVVLGLQALAFGAFHVDIAQGMATFILGLGFGFLRLKTRTLLAPMVGHATYNVVVLASMRFMHLPNNPTPNQGLGLVFGGLLLSILCAVGLQRHALVQSSLAGPI